MAEATVKTPEQIEQEAKEARAAHKQALLDTVEHFKAIKSALSKESTAEAIGFAFPGKSISFKSIADGGLSISSIVSALGTEIDKEIVIVQNQANAITV